MKKIKKLTALVLSFVVTMCSITYINAENVDVEYNDFDITEGDIDVTESGASIAIEDGDDVLVNDDDIISNDEEVSLSGAGGASFGSLRAKFPNKAYWNHIGTSNNPDGYTWSPCTHHFNCGVYANNCDCNSFSNAIQCCGFAHKITYDIYGSDFRYWSKHKNVYDVKAGDVIRYDSIYGYDHYITVLAADSVGIAYVDCNGTNGNMCQIVWDRWVSKANLSGKNPDVYSAPYDANANSDTQAPNIWTVWVTSMNSSSISIRATFSDNVGVTRVSFPTWTHNNGQDDIIWHDAQINGDSADITIPYSQHNNEGGWYATHVYAFDVAGNNACYAINYNVTEGKIACSVDGGELQYTPGGKIVGISDSVENFNIPQKVHGVENLLTMIGEGACKNKTNLKTVTLSSSIGYICENAFEGCTSLETVDTAKASNLFSIEKNTFKDCINLKNIALSDVVHYIGEYAFSGCKSLKTINLKNVTSLERNAFDGSGLESVEMPTKITDERYVNSCVFCNCDNLKNVKMTEIFMQYYYSRAVFKNSRNIENITLDKDVVTFYRYLPRNDEDPYAIFTFPKLQNVYVENGNKTFKSVNGILYTIDGKELMVYPSGKKETDFVIPDDVEKLSSTAFNYNSVLHSITIPKTVESIDKSCFKNLSGLKTVYTYRGAVADNLSLYPNGTEIVYLDKDNSSTETSTELTTESITETTTELTTENSTATTESTSTEITETTTDMILYGDVDNNGTLNRIDLVSFSKYFSGAISNIFDKAADVNHDGSVGRMDLVKLAKYFAGAVSVLNYTEL